MIKRASTDVDTWAEQQFGRCELGDTRRTRRLVDYAARQAKQPEQSTHVVCGSDDAIAEGTYRWLRNPAIDPKAVEEGPFRMTAQACSGHELVLAVQDTTTLTFSSLAGDDMGRLTSVEGHCVAGMLVHSTLMVDPETREPLGLLDQHRWTRAIKTAGGPSKREKDRIKKRLPYHLKEGVKWEQASERVRSRLEPTANVVTVCDREADIYEFLSFLIATGQRFVVRSCHNRRVAERGSYLFETMAKLPVIGARRVEISQRGPQRFSKGQSKRNGRAARTADVAIRATTLHIALPDKKPGGPESLELAVVYLRERHSPRDQTPIEWLLYTSEPINSQKEIEKVISFYECRWLIEEYHKAWKSGCKIEQRRLQTQANLERLMVITSAIAVRLLQLRSIAVRNPKTPCSRFLSQQQWQCLHAKIEPSCPIPKRAPTTRWALEALASLAGWRDTKHTGQIGWQTLWRGWNSLDGLVEGWSLARGQ